MVRCNVSELESYGVMTTNQVKDSEADSHGFVAIGPEVGVRVVIRVVGNSATTARESESEL